MTTIIIIVAIIFVLIFIIGGATKSKDGIVKKSNSNKNCSWCKALINNVTVVEGGLGKLKEGGEICINCYAKIASENSKINSPFKKQNYLEDDKNIIADFKYKAAFTINNRPLPITNPDKFNVPKNETIEQNDLKDEIDSLKLNTLAQITYIDGQGQQSVRRITMKSINKTYDNDYLIQAYCHEKNATRSFKLSRILSLVDMETGEIFSDPSKYFLDRLHDSPLGQITKCFQELETEILILAFVGRADGFLRKKEREIIMNYVLQKSSLPLDTKLMDDEIRRTYCDSADFRTALKTLNKKTFAEKEIIFQLATNIVQTDKKPDPMELGTLELIKKELQMDKASA